MSKKISKVFGIILMIFAIIITLVGICGLAFIIIPKLGRTYYPLDYIMAAIGVVALIIGVWLISIWCLKFSKGKNLIGLVVAGVLLFAAYIVIRFPLNNMQDSFIEERKGFHQVKEITYKVYGMEYTIPAGWTKDPVTTGDVWEERLHFPFTRMDMEQGNFLVYGVDCEFTDNDYTGDYSSFLKFWYGDFQNYTIIDTKYIRNEKYDIAALVQENTAVYDGQLYHDLNYVVEDRVNNKLYLIEYRKWDFLTAEDYANFEVIIDNLK